MQPLVRPFTILRNVGGLTFDATFEETHESELEVTDNPLETGSVVADHAFMKPLKLTLQAGVTNTPLHRLVNDPYSASHVTRIQSAFDLLRTLQALAEPFDIQTGLVLYRNMVCTSLKTKQDKESANAIIFEASFRELIFVTTQVVTYPPRAIRHSAPKRTKGEQQAKQETDKDKKSSLVFKLQQLFSGAAKAVTSATAGAKP